MSEIFQIFPVNPCTSCGACCAFYRVSFYWGETDSNATGPVPSDYTEALTTFKVAMKGTNQNKPRCQALHGTIGECVYCDIYAQRPSVCREFKMAWEDGEPYDLCDKARLAWGLPPLEPPNSDEPAHAA